MYTVTLLAGEKYHAFLLSVSLLCSPSCLRPVQFRGTSLGSFSRSSPHRAEGRPLCIIRRGPSLPGPGRPDSQLQRLAQRIASGLAIDGCTSCECRGSPRLLGTTRTPGRPL